MQQKAARLESLVSMATEGHIRIITFCNPEKANALSESVIRGLLSAFDQAEADGARVVILRAAAGCRIWSAGHDLDDIVPDGSDPLTYFTPFEMLLHRVRQLSPPVIGMIEGSVWGGACDLAMTCDLLVGTPESSFAITPAKLGIAYNTAGLTHFLGVVPIHIAKEMLFTANPIPAETAFRLGILNRLTDAGKLEEVTLDLARTIASRAPLAVQLLKAELRKLTNAPAISPDDYEEIQALRRKAYRSNDFREGVKAFYEKRTPEFKGE